MLVEESSCAMVEYHDLAASEVVFPGTLRRRTLALASLMLEYRLMVLYPTELAAWYPHPRYVEGSKVVLHHERFLALEWRLEHQSQSQHLLPAEPLVDFLLPIQRRIAASEHSGILRSRGRGCGLYHVLQICRFLALLVRADRLHSHVCACS